MEEPGFEEGARHALGAAGAELVPAAVDDEGFDPAILAGAGRRARLAYVTPSPVPARRRDAIPAPRRPARLGGGRRGRDRGRYDGEFRFAGRPLDALKALDQAQRVLYVGTCSKVMFPALRIGYAVLPPALVEPFARAKAIADGGFPPVLEQDALADFIASGDFERHLRRSRTRVGARRAIAAGGAARR
ncbi:MAG: hypothetical protein U0802_07475 [Candidatus Binatia bacterium]